MFTSVPNYEIHGGLICHPKFQSTITSGLLETTNPSGCPGPSYLLPKADILLSLLPPYPLPLNMIQTLSCSDVMPSSMTSCSPVDHVTHWRVLLSHQRALFGLSLWYETMN